MTTPETGTDNLRRISDRLARHEAALPRFRAEGNQDYCHGFGRELTLPDGRRYGAYAGARGSAGERIQIDFFGEAIADPDQLAMLGFIVLLTNVEKPGVRINARSMGRNPYLSEPPLHSYPKIEDLARPLGDWLADGVAETVRRGESLADADSDFHRHLKGLETYLNGEGRQVKRETALATGTNLLNRALNANERHKVWAVETSYSPVLDDVRPLHDLVYEPGGVSIFVERDRATQLEVPTYVPGLRAD